MELVKDLSTAAFLNALKGFVATRGPPRCIWSDNFCARRTSLRRCVSSLDARQHQSKVYDHCLASGFDLRFIPPRSLHFGGLWKAAVKMAKHHLYRSLGSSILGFDELRTLVCQVQEINNSLPLAPLSDSPDDLGMLTPRYFLIGRHLLSQISPR